MYNYKEFFLKGEIVFNQILERVHLDALRSFAVNSGLLTQTNLQFPENRIAFNKAKAPIESFNVNLGRGKSLMGITFHEVLQELLNLPELQNLEPNGTVISVETGTTTPKITKYEVENGHVKSTNGRIVYRNTKDKVI